MMKPLERIRIDEMKRRRRRRRIRGEDGEGLWRWEIPKGRSEEDKFGHEMMWMRWGRQVR